MYSDFFFLEIFSTSKSSRSLRQIEGSTWSCVASSRRSCDERHLMVALVSASCSVYHPRPRASWIIPLLYVPSHSSEAASPIFHGQTRLDKILGSVVHKSEPPMARLAPPNVSERCCTQESDPLAVSVMANKNLWKHRIGFCCMHACILSLMLIYSIVAAIDVALR